MEGIVETGMNFSGHFRDSMRESLQCNLVWQFINSKSDNESEHIVAHYTPNLFIANVFCMLETVYYHLSSVNVRRDIS